MWALSSRDLHHTSEYCNAKAFCNLSFWGLRRLCYTCTAASLTISNQFEILHLSPPQRLCYGPESSNPLVTCLIPLAVSLHPGMVQKPINSHLSRTKEATSLRTHWGSLYQMFPWEDLKVLKNHGSAARIKHYILEYCSIMPDKLQSNKLKDGVDVRIKGIIRDNLGFYMEIKWSIYQQVSAIQRLCVYQKRKLQNAWRVIHITM